MKLNCHTLQEYEVYRVEEHYQFLNEKLEKKRNLELRGQQELQKVLTEHGNLNDCINLAQDN